MLTPKKAISALADVLESHVSLESQDAYKLSASALATLSNHGIAPGGWQAFCALAAGLKCLEFKSHGLVCHDLEALRAHADEPTDLMMAFMIAPPPVVLASVCIAWGAHPLVGLAVAKRRLGQPLDGPLADIPAAAEFELSWEKFMASMIEMMQLQWDSESMIDALIACAPSAVAGPFGISGAPPSRVCASQAIIDLADGVFKPAGLLELSLH